MMDVTSDDRGVTYHFGFAPTPAAPGKRADLAEAIAAAERGRTYHFAGKS